VGNVALVDLALARVAAVTDAVAVNVHHGRPLLEAHLAGRVHLSIEAPEALGTAGALGRLRDWIAGRPCLVVNADAWHPVPLGPLVEGWDGERVRLAVVEDAERGDFGSARFAGASLMPWSAVASLEPRPSGLYEVCWRPAMASGRLDLATTAGPFFDCGTPSDYLAANLTASGGASVVGPGAVVGGDLLRSVVWPGAVVRRGERLVECIRAGTDVTVEAPLSDRFRARPPG
jgi:N-acetyl-alpha-D-muramate 1-phosphate uridylyltransferase